MLLMEALKLDLNFQAATWLLDMSSNTKLLITNMGQNSVLQASYTGCPKKAERRIFSTLRAKSVTFFNITK